MRTGLLIFALLAAFSTQAALEEHRLSVGLRTEPRTLNPIFAMDDPSRTVINLLHASLVRTNGETQQAEMMLAESCRLLQGGRRLLVKLRTGLRFSDGQPLTADDVVFSFAVHLDERVASPQRDLLIIGGKPVTVRKLDSQSVEFVLAEPYALGERLLAGVPILPRRLLEAGQKAGTLKAAWPLGTVPSQVVGAGPFSLKEYVPGQSLTLQRNPHYWRRDGAGKRLPYVDEMQLTFASNEDGQVARLISGEAHLAAGLSPSAFPVLAQQKQPMRLLDMGPGLDYTFLLFNLANAADPGQQTRRAWLQNAAFRQAVAAALDREGIARLVYRGRATLLRSYVSPGRKRWAHVGLPVARKNLATAQSLLRQAGFILNEGVLRDPAGQPVRLTLLASAGNQAYLQTASIIEEDLKQLGIQAQVVPLEFRTMVDRITVKRDFDAAIMALRGGDADPLADMNVLLSTGQTHLWNLGLSGPATPWEAEIDRLMREQMVTLNFAKRKRLFDRVQEVLAEQVPFISLVSPHVLVAVHPGLQNVKPSAVGHPVLWNADELRWAQAKGTAR